MARRVGSVTAPVECTGHETAASVCQDRATPIDAVVFDLDGVITDTARTHASAWKATFDVFLNSMSSFSTPQAEFDASADYVRYVDGKLRIEGIASFLRSRHIELPLGQPDDTALTSVYGIGNSKNRAFLALLESEGVPVFADAMECLRGLRRLGIRLGLASSSKNCSFIRERTGISEFFEVTVDGACLEARGLKSKPSPDIFLETARQLEAEIKRVAIVEDAAAGVRAARDSGAGLVVGLDRTGGGRRLREHGADVVLLSLEGFEQILARHGASRGR